ncbi:hypothetical protein A0H76_301 [Hepatospora eriocheir]|uniref:Uncharacterized protein n=1 Tax=Hepatospora eriocheir TaxID=1081669 RepID=A0A1X0QIX1_9MICR|nr:hypothetical protein A0H76_301 [Hepatospora eriocheir]
MFINKKNKVDQNTLFNNYFNGAVNRMLNTVNNLTKPRKEQNSNFYSSLVNNALIRITSNCTCNIGIKRDVKFYILIMCGIVLSNIKIRIVDNELDVIIDQIKIVEYLDTFLSENILGDGRLRDLHKLLTNTSLKSLSIFFLILMTECTFITLLTDLKNHQ